ncbi:hypothetical protein J8L88_13155 [Aquimarina sp. MMG015]|uniref:hypothetical protein n=1 Tax=Aquimarina TaxID=290174 RepID=UPI00040E88D9|nr:MULTISPECIES: hypothetical protein [Aquimarina]AXT56102.1 hypothetical protein D1815_10195 [Aquimarina sp. AD1]MBQ4803804.1 hypothetical protein [Aquimarina sp. MMG015]
MLPDNNNNFIRTHELDIGSFHFYKNYLVSEMKEGASINYDKANKLFLLAKEYYGISTPFVYITNRINSYSFEPTTHFKSGKLFPNLKGYGVVTYNAINNKIASLEQSFLDVPTKIFDNLKEAVLWVDEIITVD